MLFFFWLLSRFPKDTQPGLLRAQNPSKKLIELGMEFCSMEQIIKDAVESLKSKGYIVSFWHNSGKTMLLDPTVHDCTVVRFLGEENMLCARVRSWSTTLLALAKCATLMRVPTLMCYVLSYFPWECLGNFVLYPILFARVLSIAPELVYFLIPLDFFLNIIF